MRRLRVWWAFRRWARTRELRRGDSVRIWMEVGEIEVRRLIVAMRRAGLVEYACRYGKATIGPGRLEWSVTAPSRLEAPDAP